MLRESSATTTAPILRGARVSINSSQAFSSVGGGGGGGVGRESVGKRPILIRKKNIASAMGISSENDQDNAEVNDNGKMYSSRDAEAVELYKFLNTQRPVNKNMLVAVQKAEKSHVVRRKLHQFDQRILKAASKRHRSAVINLLSTDYTSSVDVEMAIAEQESNKMSTSNDLQVGYEKLNIMPLEEVDVKCVVIAG